MNLFTVHMKNQPGELAHLCEVLAARGVNLDIAGFGTGDQGTVVFAASDETAAAVALGRAGIEYDARPGLLVRCPDEPGEGAKLARELATANINIEAMLEATIAHGEVAIAFLVDKVEEARAALGEKVVG